MARQQARSSHHWVQRILKKEQGPRRLRMTLAWGCHLHWERAELMVLVSEQAGKQQTAELRQLEVAGDLKKMRRQQRVQR